MKDWKRRWVHWSTFSGSLVILSGAFALLLMALSPMDRRALLDPAALVTALLIALSLSHIIASTVSRRWRRPMADLDTALVQSAPARELAPGEGASVHTTRDALFLVGTFTGFFAALAWVLTLGIAADCGTEPLPMWYAIPLGLTVVSVGCWWGFIAQGRMVAEASQKGIRTQSGFARQTTVPWEQIAGYNVVTERDPLGGVATRKWVFTNSQGRVVLRLDLDAVPPAEREQFLALIRSKQGLQPPAAELIAASAPEGTGIEPIAAPDPVGRGTELASAPAPGGRGTELASARAPGGRGTELASAPAPAGRGTEPEAASAPAIRAGDVAPAAEPRQRPARMPGRQ